MRHTFATILECSPLSPYDDSCHDQTEKSTEHVSLHKWIEKRCYVQLSWSCIAHGADHRPWGLQNWPPFFLVIQQVKPL